MDNQFNDWFACIVERSYQLVVGVLFDLGSYELFAAGLADSRSSGDGFCRYCQQQTDD